MYRGVLGFLCATALASGAATAADFDGGPAVASFEITGFVPVVCRANLASNVVPLSGSEVSLGALSEFCNSPRGYDIFVESSPELADAKLIVDGREIALSDSGPTLVVSTNAPGMTTRDVRLANAGSGGSLNFRIVAR
jgi:hypothetical protein